MLVASGEKNGAYASVVSGSGRTSPVSRSRRKRAVEFPCRAV
jgi:hypothetical protein